MINMIKFPFYLEILRFKAIFIKIMKQHKKNLVYVKHFDKINHLNNFFYINLKEILLTSKINNNKLDLKYNY